MKKRMKGFYMFVSSCIPGCGQMYLGYMKRGLSLMLVFWGIMAIAYFLNVEALVVLLIPAWLYTYFDSYNLRARVESGTAEEDDYLFCLSDLDSEKFSALCRRRHSIIGYVLVGLGVYMLYDRIIRRLCDFLWRFEYLDCLYELLVYDVPRLVVTFGIIALGLWFIRGPRKAEDVEDIPVFTPPVTEETPEEPTAEQDEEADHGEE